MKHFYINKEDQLEADMDVLKDKYFELIQMKSRRKGYYPTKTSFHQAVDEGRVDAVIQQDGPEEEWKLRHVKIHARLLPDQKSTTRLDYEFRAWNSI